MRTQRLRWRPTIRARLTLLYAGAFFLAAGAVVVVLYLYLGQVLDHQSGSTVAAQHLSPEQHDTLTTELQRARDDTLRVMLVASLVALGIVGVVAGGIGWLLAGRALAPLQQITATARRVADRRLHERIELDGPDDEIKDLANTFDAMLERLDRAFDGQRQFVANASHELRTPLAINRTLIEVALEKSEATEPLGELGTKLLAVNERHERLIDGLLLLAGSDQRIIDPVPLDLADIARNVTAESQGAAKDAGVDLRTDLHPAPAPGDPVLLERLVQNLVDNAIRYNLPNVGWIVVTTNVHDGAAWLIVENTGPVVAPGEVPQIFEPFRRSAMTDRLADSPDALAGRGAGLGLSIVRSIARAHGAFVSASPREDGGLTVEVRTPTASDLGRTGA